MAQPTWKTVSPTLTLAVKRWPQGEVYNVNHFEDGYCCVKMFAVCSMPDSKRETSKRFL